MDRSEGAFIEVGFREYNVTFVRYFDGLILVHARVRDPILHALTSGITPQIHEFYSLNM
jgi:hypothetical protein